MSNEDFSCTSESVNEYLAQRRKLLLPRPFPEGISCGHKIFFQEEREDCAENSDYDCKKEATDVICEYDEVKYPENSIEYTALGTERTVATLVSDAANHNAFQETSFVHDQLTFSLEDRDGQRLRQLRALEHQSLATEADLSSMWNIEDRRIRFESFCIHTAMIESTAYRLMEYERYAAEIQNMIVEDQEALEIRFLSHERRSMTAALSDSLLFKNLVWELKNMRALMREDIDSKILSDSYIEVEFLKREDSLAADARSLRDNSAILIQSFIRMHNHRKIFQLSRCSARRIQASYRAHVSRNKFIKQYGGLPRYLVDMKRQDYRRVVLEKRRNLYFELNEALTELSEFDLAFFDSVQFNFLEDETEFLSLEFVLKLQRISSGPEILSEYEQKIEKDPGRVKEFVPARNNSRRSQHHGKRRRNTILRSCSWR